MTDRQLAALYKAMYDSSRDENAALRACVKALCEDDPDAARDALRPLLPRLA